jgi:SAM-dependent methyltransferase
MSAPFAMNSYLGMRILALVREGDYAHAGEEEAIELAMAAIERDPRRLILDAGCGRGGTAGYLVKNGWGGVIGIDIQAESIEAARKNYPNATFLAGDVCAVERQMTERPDVICMFNAYYCFKDQPGALQALSRVARPGTRMIMFDHVDRGGYQDNPLLDAGEPFLHNPPRLDEIADRLAEAGWHEPAIREIHDAYIGWYRRLVDRIEHARGAIVEVAGEPGYEHVLRLYRGLVAAAEQGRLGAAIVSAVRT